MSYNVIMLSTLQLKYAFARVHINLTNNFGGQKMIKKLVIRVTNEQEGNISDEELKEVKTEIIDLLVKSGLIEGKIISQLTERAIIIESNKDGFSLLGSANISDMLSKIFYVKEFSYKADYDVVSEEEPHIVIEVDKK